MKYNRVAGMALAGLCVMGASNAFADDVGSIKAGESVAVMKIDTTSASQDAAADALLSAIRKEITNSEFVLDANGSDITYTEMQMVTGCDKEGSIACYDAACETLGSKTIIFGNIKDDGNATVIWYASGIGIYRSANAKLTDKTSVQKLAREIVIGKLGSVIVTSNIPGADVFIDGRRVGVSAEYEENATPFELVVGKHSIAVRQDGFTKEDAVTVDIKGGEVSKVHVDMNVARDPEDTRQAVLIAGYASLGVGAAALIAGGVIGALTMSENKKFNDAIQGGDNSYKSSALLGSTGFVGTNDKGKTMALTADILMGAGGLIAAAGVALVVTGFVYDFAGEDVDKAYSNYMPKIDVSLTPNYQGMGLTWDF